MDEMDVSLHSGYVGEPGNGSLSTGSFENQLKEGNGYAGSICMGDLLGELGGRAPLLGTLKDR